MMLEKTCQSCRKFPAIRRVPSVNGKSYIWKCKTCLARKNVPGILRVKVET